MPLLNEPDSTQDDAHRSSRWWGLGVVLLVLVLVGATLFAVESSFGPVSIGNCSISGPRTWTAFPGRARVLLDCGGYKLWWCQDPRVFDGT